MDSTEKFWLWLWIVTFAAIITFTGIVFEMRTEQLRNEQQTILNLVDKGYTLNQATCAITTDGYICKIAQNENVIRIKKD